MDTLYLYIEFSLSYIQLQLSLGSASKFCRSLLFVNHLVFIECRYSNCPACIYKHLIELENLNQGVLDGCDLKEPNDANLISGLLIKLRDMMEHMKMAGFDLKNCENKHDLEDDIDDMRELLN